MRKNNVRAPSSFLCLLCLAVWLATPIGCTGRPGPEDNSGHDTSRSGAVTAPFDVAITDAVNYEGGDATDWKKFEIAQAGQVTVDIYWDTETVLGEVSLHDQYGATITSATHDRSGQHDQITANLPADGLYYIRIRTTGGRSTYSIRLYLGPPRESGQMQEDPRPEFDRPI
ncbi:MAG: PPC domain-containing protein [Bradymonadales bacterium]|nr:PPC domain-containing protein [Bradymonadales bacterium]